MHFLLFLFHKASNMVCFLSFPLKTTFINFHSLSWRSALCILSEEEGLSY